VWALPTAPQWINYEKAWVNSNLSHFFFNSICVTLLGIVATALLASMASYVIARYQFPGSRFFLVYFLSGFAIPIQLTIVPLFLLLSRVGLINNLFVLAALYIAGALSFSIFTMIGFFRSLPKELEEAAILDGATDYQVFWRVMLPLARPGLVTITIFNFLYIWNEYFTAVLLINDSDKMTVSVGLYFLKATQGYAANWVGMLAGLIIVLIPNIIFFLIFQRQIAGGLTVGALKG
jgi:N-acetylglucosamine transport system permease protein